MHDSKNDKIKEHSPLDFEEYLRASEPHKQERAYNWRTAIGLQAVDGLRVSDYLKQTAQRNIEGEITIDEAQELIKSYYQSKTNREPDDDEKQEADKVSANISRILSRQTLDFTAKGFFSYQGLTGDEIIAHIVKFVSGLWQIHPFGEGNTRTTAVFVIQYLRSIGFNVNNDLFAENSWYFRNALVRANYKNAVKGIEYTPVYLERFFRNLLLGKQNELRNRYLLISLSPDEMADPTSTRQVPDKYPTSSEQIPSKFQTNNPNIVNLVLALGQKELSMKELLQVFGLKDRENFLHLFLNPAMDEGFVKLLYPEKPRHPRQKYLLTVKGLAFYQELNKVE